MTYFVEISNTLHDEVIRLGECEFLEQALALARNAIDDYLQVHLRYSRSANTLYSMYVHAALVPCIFRDDNETINVRCFDHLQYASLKCVAMYAPRSTS